MHMYYMYVYVVRMYLFLSGCDISDLIYMKYIFFKSDGHEIRISAGIGATNSSKPLVLCI